MQTIAIPDWLDFPDLDKPYVEQIYDRREAKVSPRRTHARLQGRMFAILEGWAGERGEVGTEWRCYLIAGEDRPSSLLPDVSYFSFERLARSLPEDARERPRIAPDIAVEILSPGDRRRSLTEKIALYVHHGCRVAIVIDPAKRTVMMHGKDGSLTVEALGRIAIAPYDDLILDCDQLFRDI
jgi:Uma2 family endonuclease